MVHISLLHGKAPSSVLVCYVSYYCVLIYLLPVHIRKGCGYIDTYICKLIDHVELDLAIYVHSLA
jgi:hypothetical protein